MDQPNVLRAAQSSLALLTGCSLLPAVLILPRSGPHEPLRVSLSTPVALIEGEYGRSLDAVLDNVGRRHVKEEKSGFGFKIRVVLDSKAAVVGRVPCGSKQVGVSEC